MKRKKKRGEAPQMGKNYHTLKPENENILATFLLPHISDNNGQ